MPSPLLVTRDETLHQELLRLAAAAGVLPDLARDGPTALGGWTAAPVVLLGADLLDELAEIGPPRRRGVHVVAWGPVSDAVFRAAVAVGAEHVSELPRAESWVVELLTDLDETSAGLVLGVVGGSGGAGASVFACALGQVAARSGPAAVIDLDPLGARLDRVLGCEELPGVRWDAMAQTSGRLSARSLRSALPRRAGLGVLTWPPGWAGELPAEAARQVLAAAQRGHDVVVVDLPRGVDPVVVETAIRCDHLFLVVTTTLLGISSATRLCAALPAGPTMSVVARRAGIDAREAAALVGLPLTAEMGDQRGLAEAVELGAGPVRARRGPLARAAGEALRVAARTRSAPAGLTA